MTAEDWKKVEAALSGPYGCASFTVDGYALTLQVKQVKPLKFAVMVYVNGWFKGELLQNDCEERRRFYCPKKGRVFTAASKAKLTKGLSKRAIARYLPDIDKTFSYWLPVWSSFAPLKRHLVANNKSIELQECFP